MIEKKIREIERERIKKRIEDFPLKEKRIYVEAYADALLYVQKVNPAVFMWSPLPEDDCMEYWLNS